MTVRENEQQKKVGEATVLLRNRLEINRKNLRLRLAQLLSEASFFFENPFDALE